MNFTKGQLGVALVLGLVVACGGGQSSGAPAASPTEGSSDQAPATPGEAEPQTDAAVSGGAAAAPAPEAATDAAVSPGPAPGDYQRGTRELSVDVTLRLTKDGADAGMMSKSWAFSEGRREDVVTKKGSDVIELLVRYGLREGKGLEDWTPLPTQGKGYKITARDGKWSAEPQEGKLSAGERTVVESEYRWVGGPTPLGARFAKATIGEALTLNEQETRALVGFWPEVEEKSLNVTVTSRANGVAQLELAYVSLLREKEMEYTFTMSGPGTVDLRTGWVTGLKLDGSVKVAGKKQYKGKTLDVSGSGKVHFQREATLGHEK